MTKFSDQLFDDLIQEHGPQLAATRVPAAPKRRVAHPVRLSAVGGGIAAVAAAVGLLTAGGASPAYAVTSNANGSVSLDVYNQSGIAGANQALQKMGDGRVVLVADQTICRSINSLPKAPGAPKIRVSGFAKEQANGKYLSVVPGSFTVYAHDIPKGDTLAVVVENLAFVKQSKIVKTVTAVVATRLTRGPVPSCLSLAGSDAGPATPAAS
ncbi:MAG TPA: hypothetical protein VIZ43_28690 [Trebonia sp.]